MKIFAGDFDHFDWSSFCAGCKMSKMEPFSLQAGHIVHINKAIHVGGILSKLSGPLREIEM